MCACEVQMALRGLSGFLSLEQIWIILPHGGKEIFCLEVMAAIPKAKYWFKPNDICFWTLTQNSDWADASVFWAYTRANDYLLRLLPSSPLPVSLSLSTTPLKPHSKENRKGFWSLVSAHISSIEIRSCYGYLSYELNSPIPVHFSSLIPRMLMFTLTICLTTSNLPWFIELTFHVPMQYCSLQHGT